MLSSVHMSQEEEIFNFFFWEKKYLKFHNFSIAVINV